MTWMAFVKTEIIGGLGSGQGIVNVKQDIALTKRERQRILLENVLPAKEERFRPGSAGQPEGVPRSQVVRFFVDVDDLRLYVSEAGGKRREIVQMEIAVEAHGLDAQIVALCVSAFKAHLAGRITPEWRHDDRQLHIRQPCHLFEFALVDADDDSF